MISLLTLVGNEIDAAGSQPIAEVEVILTRAATLLGDLPAFAMKCSGEDRKSLCLQVLALRTRLAKLNRVMERSSELFRGYSRVAGLSFQEYTPDGLTHTSRDPAFFSISL